MWQVVSACIPVERRLYNVPVPSLSSNSALKKTADEVESIVGKSELYPVISGLIMLTFV
jgi:hypothetical protein